MFSICFLSILLNCDRNNFVFDLQAGVGVEFVRILPETHAPTLTNIFAERDSRDDIVSKT